MKHPLQFSSDRGASLTEVVIVAALSLVVVGGAATVLTRAVAGAKHTDWQGEVSSLRSTVRRYADCKQTLQTATCDGYTPVALLRSSGASLIGVAPNNKVGSLTVRTTCNAGSLVVTASSPQAVDPLTKAPLSFSVIGQKEHLCGDAVAMPPLYSSNTLLQDKGVTCGTGVEVYSVTATCPPGYQVLGGSPMCNFPAKYADANGNWYSGGLVVSSYPVPGTQSWAGLCCSFTFQNIGGNVVQPNTAVCYRLNRSGKLDNE